MARWVKIRSWHIVRTPTRVPNNFITRCGRRVTTTEYAAELQLDEKSCETCLRLEAAGGGH